MSDDKKSVAARDSAGRFVKGSTGNPMGRPKGRKNHLVQLKQDLEIAVRENVTAKDVSKILKKMVEMAKEGDKGAAKLILDRMISPARVDEDGNENLGGIKVVVENATFAMQPKDVEGEVIEQE